ncbi:MAG TPA: TIGR04282 family arsenosugar biosynthesis glycosyltransferase [Candidatus Polarisedimenticolaceae bacterium]|nr:TIGR04282 family arsenosugar biosynthesis glycosyltransferase [Candidatus Polarisedimenticolaceae bacterium]
MHWLLLFGKRPRRGRVKTRLVPPLTDEHALRLYRAFLVDQLRFVRGFHGVRAAWVADGPLDAASDRELPIDGVERLEQGEGDLGARLRRAFAAATRRGAGPTVVIGTDSPTLPETHVLRAFELLESGAPAVMAPSYDGGYVLIGCVGSRSELFERVPWGGPAVAETTRRRAVQAGIALHTIDPWYDVDDREGLDRLRRELRDPSAARRAPRTARALLDLPFDPVV